MELLNNVLVVTMEDLQITGKSEGTLKSAISRGQIVRFGRGLYRYDSLGVKWQADVKAVLHIILNDERAKGLEPEQYYKLIALESSSNAVQTQKNSLVKLHESTFLNIADFNYYRTSHKLNAPKSTDLMAAAGWMKLLNAYHSKADTSKIGFNSKLAIRETVLEVLTERELYGLRVKNLRVLQNNEYGWRDAFSEGGLQKALDFLVPGYVGNNNAQRLGKPTGKGDILLPSGRINLAEWHAKTLAMLFMNPGKANKFDFEEIHRRYVRKCADEDQRPLSLSRVKSFLTSNEVRQYTVWERDGFAELDKMLPHVKGKRPELSLSKGGFDGLLVDFYTDVDGSRMMLTVVAVFDYASEAITGFDVGLIESGLMVRNMYRNHLKNAGGRTYLELESDRGSGNLAAETTRIFKATVKTLTQPAPNDPHGKASNPKARFVERLVQEFNRLAQNVAGWKGTNVSSIDRQRKPNPDYNSGHSVKSYQEGVKQIIDLVSIYNNVKLEKYEGRSRMEQFNHCINPAAPVVSHELSALLLNQHTIATIRNSVIKITVNKRDYEYEFYEYSQMLHLLNKKLQVRVYFEETDMTSIDVFGFDDAKNTDNDRYLATLGRLKRIQRAKAEQTHDDLAGLGKMQSKRSHALEDISRKTLELQAAAYGIELPQGITLAEMKMLVKAERELQEGVLVESVSSRFESELATENAIQTSSYYNDALLRDRGHQVPDVIVDNEQLRRAFIRRKSNK